VKHTCPVCGFAQLDEPPRGQSGGGSYEICPSCGFQFGVTDDDRGFSYAQWRKQWCKQGMKWSSRQPPPLDWNALTQLAVLSEKDPIAKPKRTKTK
jgi:hypothetical protein